MDCGTNLPAVASHPQEVPAEIGREGRTPVRPRHRQMPLVKDFWVARDDCVNDLFARCANGRTGVRPSLAAAVFFL